MKIVHVIATIDPSAGGPPSVVIRLAAAQAALGHEVHVLSYGDRATEERALKSAELVPHVGDVHLHRVDSPGLLENLLGVKASRVFERLALGADFIHAHGVWEALILRTTLIARKKGIPYCVRPAGMLDRWSLRQKKWKKRLALVLGYRGMLEKAAFIHLLNRDEERGMAPLSIKTPVHVIPNGVFIEEVERLAVKGQFRTQLASLTGKRFILFLARLHHKKGLDILADAFELIARELPDVDLIVAGPDHGAGAAFRSIVARKGLGERVHLVGPLYGSDKYAALADAACFCLPSRQEGFSVAIVEALASGVPVVISNACNFPEIRLAGAGNVTSLHPTAVASGILDVLRSPDRATRMGEKAKRLVETRYAWHGIAARTIQAYALVHQLTDLCERLPPL